jgi:hypothetical protein
MESPDHRMGGCESAVCRERTFLIPRDRLGLKFWRNNEVIILVSKKTIANLTSVVNQLKASPAFRKTTFV